MSGRLGPELRIDLLGGFQVAADEIPVDEKAWRLRNARRLVKLLVLSPGHSLHREAVIETLWPERDPGPASNNLRQALFVARRALDSCGLDGAAALEFSRDVISLDPAALRVDVEAFEAAAAQAEREPSPELLNAAIALYGGELLPEDRFESWATARRAALHERHLSLLIELAALHDQAGDRAEAVAAYQRALLADPLNERAHRGLMRIYALTGARHRALAQFHLLRESLRREFEDDPEEDTRRLYQDILTRRLYSGPGPEPGTPRVPGSPAGADHARERPGNLPVQLTSFVGRGRELREITGLARRNRLLTLTGPGGCGKTRLALLVAKALQEDLAHGVWLVELAGLSDGALVPHAVGSVLGVENRSTRSFEEAVIAHVGEQELLLVLDNCEHLARACRGLAVHLLTGCPNLRVLATSREPLHAAGEVDWRVPSLAPSEAAALFNDRATSVSSRFVQSEQSNAAVAEVCRRVDGIPLAIELAAARVGVLAPGQIAERLQHSLAVLEDRRHAGLTRQQTLTATLDWSYELLDEAERALLRRLGVFAGSCDLEAVENVCEGDLGALAGLEDKSLVTVEEPAGSARYRLLETVRHYARERLADSGERERYEARHRAHYLALAEELEPQIDSAPIRRRLAEEADELRRALRTALRHEPAAALRLATALWRFWHDRGDRTEGVRWLEQALNSAAQPAALRARALHGLSVLAMRTSDPRRAMNAADEELVLYRGLGDQRALAETLHHMATMAWVFSDFDAAQRWCEESRAVALGTGEPALMASVLHTLGVIAASRDETETGRSLLARSVELLRELPDDHPLLLLPVALGRGRFPRRGGGPRRTLLEQTFVTARHLSAPGAVAAAMGNLALAAREDGDPLTARTLLEESLFMSRRLGDELGAAQALSLLGNLMAIEGEHEAARECHAQSLAMREAAGDARAVGLSLMAIAMTAGLAGEPARARSSAERALGLFERTGDGPGSAWGAIQLGYVAADAGDLREARQLQERSLGLWQSFMPDSVWGTAAVLELSALDEALGLPGRAADRLRQAQAILVQRGHHAAAAECQALLRAGERRANAGVTGAP